MSTHVPRFQSFFRFLHHFVSAKLATSSRRVKPCCVSIHGIALTEYSRISTYVPGFQSFFRFSHHLVSAKLATSSIRVKRVAQPYRKGSLLRDKYAASGKNGLTSKGLSKQSREFKVTPQLSKLPKLTSAHSQKTLS